MRPRVLLLCLAVSAFFSATELTAQVICPRGTLPAYAHNDYANPRPLFDALWLGYRGVEADIFLVDGELRLGHDRDEARNGAAFEVIYLAPLRSLVARCGQLTVDGRPFLLTVEIKEKSRPTFDTLVALIGRYSELFSPTHGHTQPEVQAVLVGWEPPGVALGHGVPLGRQVQVSRSDGQMVKITDPAVRLISVDYSKTMGRWWVTPGARRHWYSTIRTLRDAYPTLLIRVHHAPAKESVYDKLLAAGVDLIGTQHLYETARILDPGSFPSSER